MRGIQNPRLTDKGKAVLDAMREIDLAREKGQFHDASGLPDEVREALVHLGYSSEAAGVIAKCKWCGCDKPSPDHWDTEIDFS